MYRYTLSNVPSSAKAGHKYNMWATVVMMGCVHYYLLWLVEKEYKVTPNPPHPLPPHSHPTPPHPYLTSLPQS